MGHLIGELDAPDIGVICGYFVLVIGVGIWASCSNRGSVGGYFLAGRSMNWILVGASLFASNIGSGHFIGLAGSGAASGIAVAVFEISAITTLVILGWVFVPVYTISGVYTMPEYLKKRFGGVRLQIYLACMALFLYIFTKISADLYAGAIFIDQAIKINLYPAIIILLIISGLFTILGGLTAVIWTDFIQTILMLIGACYLMIAAFLKVGGFQSMIHAYFNAVPNTTRIVQFEPVVNSQPYPPLPVDSGNKFAQCGIPPADAMHMFRDIEDNDLPWTGVVFGLTISNVWYWCTDQVIVQRTLSAKNLTHAKAGCLLAGICKLLPLWLLIFPGMISRILYPDEVGCGDPEICLRTCGKTSGCTDIAYPRLVLQLLPTGAKGLMLAVMIASLVSSLTSIFNSSSTLFTMDIWRRIRPRARSAELMIVGRVSTLVLICISVAWIPVVKSSGELFHYIQSVTSYLAPPVCVVFLMALFCPRFNELGAFVALMVGLCIGLIRFIWESVYPRVPCGNTAEPTLAQLFIYKLHYLHFSVILFIISGFVGWAVSICTKPPPAKNIDRLTFWSRFQPKKEGQPVLDVNGLNEAADHQIVDTTPQIHAYADMLQDEPEGEPSVKRRPWYMRAIFWVCGIETNPHDDRETVVEELTLSIDEEPKLALINEISAVVLLSAVAIMWGFFA
ncbi:Sodium/nucleoside cotransporter [Paragonimus heterotremus]|uniref:Sodium/nucleoside cotransporter n=1 Tax=Paragonimus heterotremus TaxID=100268 RepID=A0A8J4WIT8_9TREM|nr:Sodium/nucleoside cotransporter [Paragonimus heterotremus]